MHLKNGSQEPSRVSFSHSFLSFAQIYKEGSLQVAENIATTEKLVCHGSIKDIGMSLSVYVSDGKV